MNDDKEEVTAEDIKRELVEAKKEDVKREQLKVKKSKARMYMVLLFIFVVAIVGYVIFRGEYLEILEIGEQYTSIFWQNVNSICITFGINFIILFFLLYFNNRRIKKLIKVFFDEENMPMPKLANKSIAFILSILISAITSQMILKTYMLCFNSASFVEVDPIFGLDIGYFIFQKPFIEFMLLYAIFLVIGITIYTVIYYIITFNIYFDGISRETLKKSNILKQLYTKIIIITILISGYVLVQTQNIGLEKFLDLQEDTSYSLYGAGMTDKTIKLWGYRILPIIMIVSVCMAIRKFKQGKTKAVIGNILVVPTYIISLLVVMLVFQLTYVTPNELDKEKNNIADNIRNTKIAYGINIDETNINDGGETITQEMLEKCHDTISNIVIVDQDIVLKDLNASQTQKGYYKYLTTQISEHQIDGENRLVYISPREISSNNGTYNNKTYEYTHGYGIIATLATGTNSSGNLNILQKGFDNSEENVIPIIQPRIYFGLETDNNIVTNSNNRKEFDYPIEDSPKAENAENVYEGEAGLQLGFLDRFILGIKEGDLKLALSANVNQDSKIITNRNVIQRAQVVMPYLLYDDEPYMVVTDEGKLMWVLDAYTTSNNYPYSQKTTVQIDNINKLELNYIRNSVKVLIDAYNGETTFYITDKADPIASAYKKIYPDLFSEEVIPDDISRQFVYPKFLYKIQANMIERYHNVQSDVLYRGDDVWDTATHNLSKVSTKVGTDIEPYYTMVDLIDEEENCLGLVLPFTPYGKQNITSYMVGTYKNGVPKLSVYRFSSDSNILGPMQLDTQIEQDEKVSEEVESLNVNGTKITKNMIIVPLNNTLLYVEPIYQQYINEVDSVPVLKKVIVASGNKLAIGDTLNIALSNLVSQYAVNIEIENTDNMEDLIKAIIRANTNLNESKASGNMEMIGKDIEKLQELIENMDKLRKELEKEEREDKRNEQTNKTVNVIANAIN